MYTPIYTNRSVCLTIFLFGPTIYLPRCLSEYLYLHVHLFRDLPTYLSVYLFTYLPYLPYLPYQIATYLPG